MKLGRRLPRSFYARPSTVVAPDLLGRVVVRTLEDGGRLAGRIVEVEAYQQDDPASHSFRGPTARNEVMFGPPGFLYVYFTYGMHFCTNVVTGQVGEGSAVLLRALEPVEGIDAMRANRGVESVRLLCSGPARLTQALAITRALGGEDVVRGSAIAVHEGTPLPRARIVRTARVGIRVAAERPWRYLERANPFVSPGRPAAAPPVRGSRRP